MLLPCSCRRRRLVCSHARPWPGFCLRCLGCRGQRQGCCEGGAGQALGVLLAPQQAGPVHVSGLAMAMGLGHGLHWHAPDWPWPAGSKPSRLRRPMSLALVGGLGHAGGRSRWQQRPAGLQPNCGWHWHSAMSVCYIRVLGFLLLTGRVYKHDAYVYEISPECEDEGAR